MSDQLSKDVFAQGYGLLCKWYKREADETVGRMFYELVCELSNEQFGYACTQAMKECAFFPTPQWLLDQALTSLEASAHEQWLAVVGCDARNEPVWDDPGTRYALGVIGGIAFLRGCDPQYLSQHQKKFVSAYITEHKKLKRDQALCGVCLPTVPAPLHIPAEINDPLEIRDWVAKERAALEIKRLKIAAASSRSQLANPNQKPQQPLLKGDEVDTPQDSF